MTTQALWMLDWIAERTWTSTSAGVVKNDRILETSHVMEDGGSSSAPGGEGIRSAA